MKHLFVLTLLAALAIGSVAAAPAVAKMSTPPAVEFSAMQQSKEDVAKPAPAEHKWEFSIAGVLSLMFLGVVTENARRTIDANLLQTHVLPAASATVHGTAINLNSLSAGRIPLVEFDVQCPATPALVDAKNLVFTIEDSADGVNFAAVVDFPTITMTGAGGAGAAAFDRRFKLPIGIRQYIRVSVTADAAAGDSTGVTYQYSLVF